MRWEKPIVEEMDVSLTANGIVNSTSEFSWLLNDSKIEKTES